MEGAEERDPLPPRRPPRAVAAAIVVTIAVVIGIVLTRGRHDAGPRPAPVAVTAPSATSPASAPAATSPGPSTAAGRGFTNTGPAVDVLDYTGVFTESGSLGSGELTYDFALVNESSRDLRVLYPVRLVGAHDVDIPVVFAGIYDQDAAARHLNDSVLTARRLMRIPAGAAVSLLLRVHVDCDNPAITGTRAGTEPVVEIALVGLLQPVVFTFANLAGGFDDAVRQVCG